MTIRALPKQFINSYTPMNDMDWKEFWNPNQEIAKSLILIQVLIIAISVGIGIFYLRTGQPDLKYVFHIGGFIGAIVPAAFIAASLLLKPKKALIYYAVIAIPLEIYNIIALFLIGAIPPYIIGTQWMFLVSESIILSLVLFPIFLIYLPSYLKKMKANLFASLFVPYLALSLVNLYPWAFLKDYVTNLTEIGEFAPLSSTISDFDFYAILKAGVLAEMALVFILSYVFYRKFSKMMEHSKR